ncbi:MAG TPA: hypothetical protein VGR03_09420 [Candidatus Acidoferrum sp.]|nr:hypothetical protein [Candidatus Acidoferrum sp.]
MAAMQTVEDAAVEFERDRTEVHVLSADLTGISVALIWNFPIALGAVAIQITLAYAIMLRLLERLAYGSPGGSGR